MMTKERSGSGDQGAMTDAAEDLLRLWGPSIRRRLFTERMAYRFAGIEDETHGRELLEWLVRADNSTLAQPFEQLVAALETQPAAPIEPLPERIVVCLALMAELIRLGASIAHAHAAAERCVTAPGWSPACATMGGRYVWFGHRGDDTISGSGRLAGLDFCDADHVTMVRADKIEVRVCDAMREAGV